MTAAVTPEPQYATGPGAAAASRGEGRVERGVPRSRDAAGDGVERLLVAEPADAAAGVEERQRGVAEVGEDLLGLDRVVVARRVLGTWRVRARPERSRAGRRRCACRASRRRRGRRGAAATSNAPPSPSRRRARARTTPGRSPQRRRRAPAWRRPAADADRRQPRRGRSWRGRSRCRGGPRRGGGRRRTHRAGARRRGRRSQRPPRRHVEPEHGVVGEALGQLPRRALRVVTPGDHGRARAGERRARAAAGL